MISTYGSGLWVGVMFGLQTMPSSLYLALCTDLPGDGWDGTALQSVEPVDTAYTRQPMPLSGNPAAFVQDDNGLVYNTYPLVFGPPTVDWGTITHFALTDDPVAGNLFMADDFLADVSSAIGVPAIVDAASLFFSLSVQVPSIEGDT